MTAAAPLPSLRAVLRERPIQIVLLSAVLLRLGLAFTSAVIHFTGDSSGYVDSGVNLFTHGTFAMTCDPRCIPTLWRTPGYPLVVGFLVGLLGAPFGVLYVVQSLLDTLTTLLVAAAGWAMGGRRTGTIAAAVYGLNPFAAVFAGQIMTESLSTLVLMSVVCLLWRLRYRDLEKKSQAGWAIVGLLLGFATLVRPVFAPLPAVLALAVFDPSKWRVQVRGWVLAAGGFALVVAPWVTRNWVVTRDGGADDSFHVLGSMLSPFYRQLATPGVVRWYWSFEEPFGWDRPREAPFSAKYFLPHEKERVEHLFEEIREAGVRVTPEVDADFDQLARERIRSHPFRTTVLPRLSKAARLWITPRVGTFGVESVRVAGGVGKLLFDLSLVYNALLALAGFAMGTLLVRIAEVRLLLAVPIFLTVVHLFVMWGCQSRYTVPGLPQMTILATLCALFLFDRLRRHSATQHA
jgi:4-amino-4-deoxy-L-arabinose transferase-like glycosyltransferase